MPLYEFKCSKCGSVFEVIQKVDEPPLKKCLKCGSSLQKLLSPPALQFKGSGWYVTDYARKETKDRNAGTKEIKKKKDSAAKKEDKKSPPSSSTQ